MRDLYLATTAKRFRAIASVSGRRRRLGIRLNDVRRTREIAASKLRHPAFGTDA